LDSYFGFPAITIGINVFYLFHALHATGPLTRRDVFYIALPTAGLIGSLVLTVLNRIVRLLEKNIFLVDGALDSEKRILGLIGRILALLEQSRDNDLDNDTPSENGLLRKLIGILRKPSN
jgi:hypothetical protein